MKQYKEVVAKLARQALDIYLGGGFPYVGEHSEIVGFIYNVPTNQVTSDVNEVYQFINGLTANNPTI